MDTVVESKAGLNTPAYAAKSAKSPLAPFSIERRTPRPHDVLIDILYCGVCHSDIHQVRDEWVDQSFPWSLATRSSGRSSMSAPM
jgi:uncharacterized zinc-type alcohol dehydrogenase-like protein